VTVRIRGIETERCVFENAAAARLLGADCLRQSRRDAKGHGAGHEPAPIGGQEVVRLHRDVSGDRVVDWSARPSMPSAARLAA
jgi:hypothetical protein